MTDHASSREEIARLLRDCRTIAVVGLSSNPARPSYRVASYMQQQGKVVIPVNPRETDVLGERAYPSLSDVPGSIDLVNVFRRSEEAGAVVDEAIRIQAKAVWLQEGVVDEAAALRARQAGLQVVMDRCWLKEYVRCVGE
ncbi:MAG: CoA-binding protein [Nitrospira sp.]|nr:CoA-binding protein [Nitrospira sp.]MCW5794228.1 CoA-binding protein [Nitrospira sp.]HNM18325.1 CoA-binding protein [Nitrospira sp.]